MSFSQRLPLQKVWREISVFQRLTQRRVKEEGAAFLLPNPADPGEIMSLMFFLIDVAVLDGCGHTV